MWLKLFVVCTVVYKENAVEQPDVQDVDVFFVAVFFSFLKAQYIVNTKTYFSYAEL